MPQPELDPLEEKRRDAALNALTQFVSKFSPAASKDTADIFYTTAEIANAISEHTGFRLDASDIFELMQQMGYSYEPSESLQFNWLLKKETAHH